MFPDDVNRLKCFFLLRSPVGVLSGSAVSAEGERDSGIDANSQGSSGSRDDNNQTAALTNNHHPTATSTHANGSNKPAETAKAAAAKTKKQQVRKNLELKF